jgi:two-component system, NtrC family, response regulator AtoC
VDDERRVGAILRDVLVELGDVVKTAVRGVEALQIVSVFQPDVVRLDLQIPGMSGVELLDHLRPDHPLLPVIIVTGNAHLEVACAALTRGAFDYVPKPSNLDVLARVVAAAVVLPLGDPAHRSDRPRS